MSTKCGVVSIVGKPNEGKSTLLNSILGTKLSIITPKPQTTRKKVLGIYTNNNVQIIFIDTPGIIKPKYELQKKMMEYVDEALEDCDLILYLISAPNLIEKGIPEFIVERFNDIKIKKIAVINKIDLLPNKKEILPHIAHLDNLGIFLEIIPISALYNQNTDKLLEIITNNLQESEFYYDEDILSTLNERFFVSELIRETIFEVFEKEIPYSTEVQITEFKERENSKWYIAADIIVERESQKMIILGEDGKSIKKIGVISRKKIEKHLQEEVFIELFVKVRAKWRNNKSKLKFLGY